MGAVSALTWEIKWDGRADDQDGDRCPFCGQLPATTDD